MPTTVLPVGRTLVTFPNLCDFKVRSGSTARLAPASSTIVSPGLATARVLAADRGSGADCNRVRLSPLPATGGIDGRNWSRGNAALRYPRGARPGLARDRL